MSNKICNTVVIELKKFTNEAVLKADYSEKKAESCANATIKCIYINFKNRLLYVPCCDQRKIHEEKQNIRADFNGENHNELAIKYQRSAQSIYAILKSKNIKKPKPAIAIEVIQDYLPVEFINIGLSEETAKMIAKDIAEHLLQKFPGVSIYISKEMVESNS